MHHVWLEFTIFTLNSTVLHSFTYAHDFRWNMVKTDGLPEGIPPPSISPWHHHSTSHSKQSDIFCLSHSISSQEKNVTYPTMLPTFFVPTVAPQVLLLQDQNP